MPKRTDIETILLIGAGPIVIGQGCEFDYSGTQACKALREEGYRLVLLNSNPATIMTDPSMADATYIEPVNWQSVEWLLEHEKPDAIISTMGGQTALNTALELEERGILKKWNVELIGADCEAIAMAEDRGRFRKAMEEIGMEVPRSRVVGSIEEAEEAAKDIGYPLIVRPCFTLGGSGGGAVFNIDDLERIVRGGLQASMTTEVLLEESVLGWKEFEMEVVCDSADNAIIVCSIENFDPMGVHTGDSIAVAPAQTLTDKELQAMRDASIAVLRKVGVRTGGSNVQFAVDPRTGRRVVIEMNPRVSRSSALASKATGFPIAWVAAKLAVGYTLDELKNGITGGVTPASFEPALDYVVVKAPRFNFDKFPDADRGLGTEMKSVGEAMALGRSFSEAMQKALRSLEIGLAGFEPPAGLPEAEEEARVMIEMELGAPTDKRVLFVAEAFRRGLSVERVAELTAIDPWFLRRIAELMEMEARLGEVSLGDLDADDFSQLKKRGFSDRRIAACLKGGEAEEEAVRRRRHSLGVRPVYKRVDTCAGEFPSVTAYLYSCYDEESEAAPDPEAKKIAILGSGPNRIGQGIEFDYCCVHASLSLREQGWQTIMINCNPETVSTDFDISDRLYFEPLTLEDVLEILHIEQTAKVIVHYGGQTPLKLSSALARAGIEIIGTQADAIDLAENRDRFRLLINELGLCQPPSAAARDGEEAVRAANELGYPVLARPSYVLGGQAMEIIASDERMRAYVQRVADLTGEDAPILIDTFLVDAQEVDVDAVCDGRKVRIAGVMQHIEEAGVHSGDSACSLPTFSIADKTVAELERQVERLALALKVVGLINVQFALHGDDIYVLEVNPRASRTVPFVAKATGYPLAAQGALCMAGEALPRQSPPWRPRLYSIKEAVFPFAKFAGVDVLLGPEMKSTGEVMGMGETMPEAFVKGLSATGGAIEPSGTVLFSVRDADKADICLVARRFVEAGYSLAATSGTATALERAGFNAVRSIPKISDPRHAGASVLDALVNGEVQFVVNTVSSNESIRDSRRLRREAMLRKITYTTTLGGARALAEALGQKNSRLYCLQQAQSGSDNKSRAAGA